MTITDAALIAVFVLVVAELVRRLRAAAPIDYTRQSELERKAQEYDALEALIDQMERDFDAHISAVTSVSQHNQAALDLVSRDVPGARQYIATYFAQVAHAKAQAKNTRLARHGNPAGRAGNGDSRLADLD